MLFEKHFALSILFLIFFHPWPSLIDAYAKSPLPEHLRRNIEKQVYREEPWGVIVVYKNSEGDLMLTAFALSELTFQSEEDKLYAETLAGD